MASVIEHGAMRAVRPDAPGTDTDIDVGPVLYSAIVPLPNHVPLEHMSVWAPHPTPVEEEDGALREIAYSKLAIRFWQTTVPYFSPSQLPSHRASTDVISHLTGSKGTTGDESRLADSAQVTVAELMFVIPGTSGFESHHLDAGLEALFTLHRAFRVLGAVSIPELTYQRLEPVTTVIRHSGDECHPLAVMDHIRILNSKGGPRLGVGTNLSPIELQRFHVLLDRMEVRDPVSSFLGHIREAEFQLSEGRSDESIVQSAIAAEVLFGLLLGFMLWESQVDKDDAAQILGRPLVPKLRSEFSGRLGGSWNLDKGTLGSWTRDVAQVRNMHVHGGYRVTGDEAFVAMESVRALRKFVSDRLFEKRNNFPKTALIILGDPGLSSRMHSPKSMYRWLEKHGGDVISWISDYVKWRDEVNAIVRQRGGSKPADSVSD